jgi:long-chain fatty acid transport protein
MSKHINPYTQIIHRLCGTWPGFCLAISLAAVGSNACADEYHYNDVLIGNRATGMGGAYTAIADDSSGLFYNPAGIVYGIGSDVSGSMNALQITDTVYKDTLGPGIDWKRESIALIPNYFGVVQPLGKGKIGFSYAVTDYTKENQDQVFGPLTLYGIDRHYVNYNDKDSTYNIGPSYAQKLTDKLSIGVTLYMHYRQRERIRTILSEYSVGAGGDYYYSSEYASIEENGIRPIFGIMWTPRDKISLGMTLSQTILLSSTRRLQTSSKAQNDSAVSHSDLESNLKRELPLTVTLGGAYFQSSSLLYSADFSYYSSTSSTGFIDRPATWNVAFGSEYYLNSDWAIRAGLYTNRANTAAVEAGQANQLDHVDLTGISLSLSHFSRNSSLTVGFSYSAGTGEAQVNTADLTKIQDLQRQSTSVYLSASYSY